MFAKLLEQLPQAHRACTKLLLEVCSKVVANEEKTRMSPKNLAIVLAPNMLRPPPSATTDHQQMVTDMQDAVQVVEQMIALHGTTDADDAVAPESALPAAGAPVDAAVKAAAVEAVAKLESDAAAAAAAAASAAPEAPDDSSAAAVSAAPADSSTEERLAALEAANGALLDLVSKLQARIEQLEEKMN